MSTTGSGNTWSKKDKYSKCPFCGKKGRYTITIMLADGNVMTSKNCKYCVKG